MESLEQRRVLAAALWHIAIEIDGSPDSGIPSFEGSGNASGTVEFDTTSGSGPLSGDGTGLVQITGVDAQGDPASCSATLSGFSLSGTVGNESITGTMTGSGNGATFTGSFGGSLDSMPTSVDPNGAASGDWMATVTLPSGVMPPCPVGLSSSESLSGTWSTTSLTLVGDIDATDGLHWARDGVLDVSFAVTDPLPGKSQALVTSTNVGLYWATGPNRSDIIAGLAPVAQWSTGMDVANVSHEFEVPDRPVGEFTNSISHLVLIADPINDQTGEDEIYELSEDNNVAAIELELWDFGDAPSPYPVELVDNGARHRSSSLILGLSIDTEADGQPSLMADGDGADEDGVVQVASILSLTGSDAYSSFTVYASETGRLDAWIDFNADGDWEDIDENIVDALPLSAGMNGVSYRVPAGHSSATAAARFRLSSVGGLSPTGEANDGEVEDYLVSVLSSVDSPPIWIDLQDSTSSLLSENGDLVVRGQTGELFRASQTSVGKMTLVGSALDENIVVEFSAGPIVPPDGLVADGGDGQNRLTLAGSGAAIVMTSEVSSEQVVQRRFAGERIVNANSIELWNFQTIDLDDTNEETPMAVYLDGDAIERLSPTNHTVLVVGGENDTVHCESNSENAWIMTTSGVVDGRFVRRGINQVGGQMIHFDLPHHWQNPISFNDVNNDSLVTAVDALRIINELNNEQYSTDSVLQPDATPAGTDPWLFFDVTGDDRVTALDALRVINYLNNQDQILSEPDSPSGEAVFAATTLDAAFTETTVRETPDSDVSDAIVDQALRQLVVGTNVDSVAVELPRSIMRIHQTPATDVQPSLNRALHEAAIFGGDWLQTLIDSVSRTTRPAV
ncbi:hypothetical protein FHS27_002642 [Rhodopirellula rubra]|uniref:GEVED domain-containing protein n=1 Tax=Aporhodopirellula rubra TaxID=980271 RepID=A0A7W5H618_9BACT|nr:GEVED domain-containing protein [Aporhodopirellula rubra]MBB3206828.1 hypothetical protein [Aporhodopirellula rubra]